MPTPALIRSLSPQGLQFAAHWEGESTSAYRDSGGIWTIGRGHTGPEVHEGLVWTQAQVDAAFAADAAEHQASVNRLLGDTIVTQGQYDALWDMAFNCGSSNLASSTLLRKVLAGDMAGADQEFVKWDHVKGQVVQGLLNRREAEAQLFEQ